MRSSPFSICGGQLISITVRTSCKARKARTPMGTLLSSRMRNAMTVGVSQDCLDLALWYFELLGNFGDAQAIVEVIDNRTDGQSSAAKDRASALKLWVDLNQRACGPVNFLGRHFAFLQIHDSMFSLKRPECRRWGSRSVYCAHPAGRGIAWCVSRPDPVDVRSRARRRNGLLHGNFLHRRCW